MAKAEENLDMALDDVISADRKGGGKGKSKGKSSAAKGESKGKAEGRAGKPKTEKAAGGNTEGKLDMSLDDVIEGAKGKGRKGKGKGKGKGEEGAQWKSGGEDKGKKWDAPWGGEDKAAGDGSKWYANAKSSYGDGGGGGGGGGKSWGGAGGGTGAKAWTSGSKDDWKDSKSWGAAKSAESWSAKAGGGANSFSSWKDDGKDKNRSWSSPKSGGDRDSGKSSWSGTSTSKHWDSGSGRDDRGSASNRGTKRGYEESHSSGRRPSSETKRIKVSNIPKTLDWRDLKDAFEKEAGPIERCELRMGEAMITFHRGQDAKKAVATFDRGELNGRTIGVELNH